jgi:succinoglycan biosynthesis protein ExoM
LARLLSSLATQQGAPSFEVIVVDNDADGSAEAVARPFDHRFRLSYLVEPVRGLSRVRNRAVAASRGAFLAFIDDDEWATPQWLAELDAAAERHFADVVVGPVTIVFDEDVPPHIRRCGLFDRASVADGARVPWYLTHTSNAYVRRAALPDQTRPFDNAFDLTGGEDIDLFGRMIDHGAYIVGASAAGVFEQRSARRANLRWVLRRALRNGTNFAQREWSHASRGRRVALAADALRQGTWEGIAGLSSWRHDRQSATPRLVTMADQVGRAAGAFGLRVFEYRKHP